MGEILVIVPCGRAKIWKRNPQQGPAQARDAYIGYPFRVNREYAERFGDRWVILSAKFGFVEPDELIPEDYNVMLGRRSPDVVSISILRDQMTALRLFEAEVVIGLGGKHYRDAVRDAFSSTPVKLVYPFGGLSLGRAVQATKHAVKTGCMVPEAPLQHVIDS